ncbi:MULTISPECIES: TetR/AcrR family transcriptional regulator [Fusobacterium]|uniref:TetR/AcrR family transcriptional regulator n=1 Tax=Fusobacterium varium ATCC 27725 TaxID=469618 RepID=A0ABM6U0U4_FUSVA|nr:MULTISPECIES: TetR/AcrR family transcriptional regulator [Fusobacterium]AVQ29893.1 TetR/AcrR family transcriptional regulator [Fusobacterium varium ATCC 27725]EES65182.1 transcriptional regulator, TetR family [Fusobacterium varium ATCC 27725]MCF0170629.1 TetR/AcrR family transcriptional regulator [Fusobacterium varium]MCF2672921.1 TetR/AcrR family transcriptional regulator [Fusobacterium varium]MCI6034009.1 TetR/AcrR family transcriptional regulator [Fusobacterium varium]
MSGVGKKEQILEAATKLILKKGYSHTSVEDITNEMGIAKGSFYTYFKSKNLLLKTIAEKKIDEMIEKQDNILKNALSFEETLKNIILVRLKFSNESMKRELVLISLIKNMEALSPEIKEILKRIGEINIDFIKKLLIKFKSELKAEEENFQRYSELISAIIREFKVVSFFLDKECNENIFIQDFDTVIEKMNNEKLEEGIDFIYRCIIKILK